MTKTTKKITGVAAAAAVLALTMLMALVAGCRSETRQLRPELAASAASGGVWLGDLRAGPLPPALGAFQANYQENAYAMNEGKRLFTAYNCTGCHAHGGGGIGPALMDQRWIYGSAPAQVFATIVEGRPNGMPSFRGRIVDFQVAQLAAYVRSLAGLAAGVAAPGRNDELQARPAENTRDRQEALPEAAPRLP